MKKNIIATLSAICVVANLSAQTTSFYEASKNIDIYSAILRELSINYVDSIDYTKICSKGLEQMLWQLDPYTKYYAETDEENLRLMTTGTYGGIGAVISKQGEYVIITDPYEGLPAQRNDVRAGDAILEIDGKSVKNFEVSAVSNLLRGQQGTELTLKLRREGEKRPIEKRFTREVVQIPTITYHALLNDSIGYIALRDFTPDSSIEFKNALTELSSKGLKRLIIDLRGNSGGLVNEANLIASLFVPRHTKIVETKGLQPQSHYTYTTPNEPQYATLPLVVMIDSQSASAAEILAGSLQDLDRAVVVGERSFGKGLVQTVRPLRHNTNLKLTTAKYYIPSGRCIQAIDYAKRDESGRIQRIPDSLTHEFRTQNGRPVRDGGGILPDSVLPYPKNDPEIVYQLYAKNLIFDFVTQYTLKHSKIASPETFNLSDSDYADFVEFVKKRDFKYDAPSGEWFKYLREYVEQEELSHEVDSLISQLDVALKPNIERNLSHFRTEIEPYIANEIVHRYYFQRGAAAHNIRYDQWLKQAIEIISDEKLCKEILH